MNVEELSSRQLANLQQECAEDRWLGKRSLRDFLALCWPFVEPSQQFVGGWHIDAMCEHLEAVARGQIKELIINVPPGCSKSTLVSVLYPAWRWINAPHLKFITASYAGKIVTRQCMKMRMLLATPFFSQRWGTQYYEWSEETAKDAVIISSGKDTQTEYHTLQMGMRFGTSVGSGQSLGNHAHEQLIDDPTNPKGTESEISIEDSIEWIDGIMSTRWVNSNDRRRVVVMQRLADRDMSGHLLATGTYEHLKIPMEFEGDKRKTSIGWCDPRKTPGELMCPDRINRDSVDAMKIILGSYGTAGQYQQRPSPEGGGIIRPEWFKRWTQATLPPKFDYMEVCVDANFKEGNKSDNASVGVWGDVGAQSFLLDAIPPRAMSYVQLREALRELRKRYMRADGSCMIRAWRIEAAANGHALINELSREIPGVVPFKPSEFGSKVARAEAASPQIEAGNVWIPTVATWVDGYLYEMETFPNGRYDDQVDMTTMHLLTRAARVRYEYTPVARANEGMRATRKGVM